MIHLTPNAAQNRVFVSPFEARKFLDSFTHYLMILKNNATEEQHACILSTVIDNERYTRADIPTNNDDPAGGSVLITDSGPLHLHDLRTELIDQQGPEGCKRSRRL